MAASAYQTRHARGDALATHRHGPAYAALVLDGSHIECSADGPRACVPGSVLLHPRFHAHGNRFGGHGAVVANLALPDAAAPPAGGGLVALQVTDLREARSVFAHGDLRGLRELLHAARPVPTQASAWQAALVRYLAEGDEPIARIAARLGVCAAHASRSIRDAYGMGPQALRRELRWRRALALMGSARSLADLAAEAGFVDQSHLHRVTRACTGLTPAQLRGRLGHVQLQHDHGPHDRIKSVQDPPPAGVAQSA